MNGTNSSNADLLKAINTLTRAVEGISKSFSDRARTSSGPGANASRAKPGQPNKSQDSSGRRAQKAADQQYERNKRLYLNQEKSFGKLIGELMDVSNSISRMTTLFEKNGNSYKTNLKKHNELLKGVLESDKIGRRFQDNFVEQMSGILKSTKGMKNQKLTATTTGGRMKELLAIQENMNAVANKVNAIKKNSGVNSAGDLKEGNIKYLMQSLSNRGMTADGMDLKKFEKDLSDHDSKIKNKRKAYIKAKASGNTGRAEKLKYEMGILKDRKDGFLKDVGGKIDKSVGGVERFNQSLTRAAVINTGLSMAADGASSAIRKLGGDGLSAGSALLMLKKAAVDYYQYIKSLAGKQMGGAHWEIAKRAMLMGASVDATANYLKSLAFQVSQLGFDKITKIVRNNRESFNKLGLFGDEALKAAGEFTHNLMMMGVHPKDEKKFNKAFGDYSERINQMAMLTGASVDEIIAQDRAIMNNTESQAMMMRLNQAERAEKMKSILVEKDRIAKMIGSNEEAAKFIQTMQKLNAESPEKRIENAMKIQQMAQMVGMGADGARLSQILMKRDEQLTDEERKFKSEAMMELGKRSRELQGGGMANEMVMGRLLEGQTDSVRQALQAGAEANLSKDQRGSIDENSKEAKQVKDTYQIGAGTATLMQWGETLKNFVSNPITNLLLGILGAVTVIAASSFVRTKFGRDTIDKAKSKLNDIIAGNKGGSSAVDKAIGGSSRAVGTTATEAGKGAVKAAAADAVASAAAKDGVAKGASKGIGKSILKKIPGVGLLAGLGFAASRAMNGDWLGAGGELASGAASTIPGLGTAASVAIDGALLARDVANASGGITSNPAETKMGQISSAAGQIGLKDQTSSINTESNDSTKQTSSLDDLIQAFNSGTEVEKTKMDEMIKLLTALIDAVKPENNGLLDAIKSGRATGISFNDLHDKRTLFATK